MQMEIIIRISNTAIFMNRVIGEFRTFWPQEVAVFNFISFMRVSTCFFSSGVRRSYGSGNPCCPRGDDELDNEKDLWVPENNNDACCAEAGMIVLKIRCFRFNAWLAGRWRVWFMVSTTSRSMSWSKKLWLSFVTVTFSFAVTERSFTQKPLQ